MVDCPYTIDDEPTEDWKVEHVLQWWLLRANAESEAEYDTIVEGLSKQLDDGKKELWEAHEQVSEIVRNSENVENQSAPINEKPNTAKPVTKASGKNNNSKRQSLEKPNPKPVVAAAKAVPKATRATRSKNTAAAAKATAVAAAPAKPEKPDTIHIDILEGPYEGSFYDLQPKARSHAWLGRSSSAKFKDRGISLPLDLEVSTSHGRFELRQGKFYYVDVASTNGTRINGEECVPNQPYALEDKGQTIIAGQTTMKVTLLKLA